jgi:hypothetical protein
LLDSERRTAGSGFTPAVFAEMLGRSGRLRRDEFELEEVHYEKLAREVERWSRRALELAHESERGSDLGLDL